MTTERGASQRVQTHRSKCDIATTDAPEFVDITDRVHEALETAQVADGHVTVTVPEGCAIVVNEYESGLVADLKKVIAHLKSSSNGSDPRIGSNSVVLPATGGRLRLGRWQRLLLVELEESADRRVNIQIVGD